MVLCFLLGLLHQLPVLLQLLLGFGQFTSIIVYLLVALFEGLFRGPLECLEVLLELQQALFLVREFGLLRLPFILFVKSLCFTARITTALYSFLQLMISVINFFC